jgi:hypothetical protein
MTELAAGDKVVWSSHGDDDTPGVVVRKITTDTELVGGEAVHKPDALKRR